MIASLVREVLAEELARLRAERGGQPRPNVREETVRIGNDDELRAFVGRVLKLADDRETRRAIEQNRLVFRLQGAAAGPSVSSRAAPTAAGHTEVIERGFFSERQADQLPKDTKKVCIGKAVRLTPLARDRLRQRGISIERMD